MISIGFAGKYQIDLHYLTMIPIYSCFKLASVVFVTFWIINNHGWCLFKLCEALALPISRAVTTNTNKLFMTTLSAASMQQSKRVLLSKPMVVHCKTMMIQSNNFGHLSLQQQQSSLFRTGPLFVENKPSSSSRQDEIAELEEQLRRLKMEQQLTSEMQQKQSSTSSKETTMELERKLEVMKGKDMILSEQELIDFGIFDEQARTGKKSTISANDQNNEKMASSNSGLLTNVIGIVAGIAFLIGFAQIPIGQDGLVQYSATGSSTTSMKQIDLGDLNPDKK